MRSVLLAGPLASFLAGCTADPFVTGDAAPTDAGTGADAVGDAIADAPAVPITVVRASPLQTNVGVDPTLLLTPAPAPGNAVIVGITCFSEVDGCVIPEGGVTDNQGNTYLRVVEGNTIGSSGTHGSRGYLFVCENVRPSMGDFRIRVNPNGAPDANYQDFAWGALEVAGLRQAGSVDRTGTTPNQCCNPSTTVSTTGPTTQGNELAVAVHTMRSNDNDVAYGFDPTWTQHHVHVNGQVGATPHSLVSKVLTQPGIVSHTWTHDPPTRGASAIIATFRGRTP